jgi:CRP-like cAMP-binding protein
MTTPISTLANLPLFAGLKRSEVRTIDHLGVWLDVESGRVLCREGEQAEEFFVLVEGSVGAQSSGGLVSILRSGDWFGEVSLLRGEPRCATVTTFTPSTIVVLNRREFAELLRIAPAVAAKLERSAARVGQMSRPSAPSEDRPMVTRPAGAGTRT